MILNEETKNNILTKKQKLEDLKIYLKTEFVGIDNIIDNVVSSMSPFYLFPESLTRPIVVNLWGMTGTGKTSLIQKIVDYLKLNKSFIKFDIGEYSGSDDTLKKDLGYEVKKLSGNNAIILFDEFQLGRTISENGNEIDRNSLRPLWELLDTGIIYTYNAGIYFGLNQLLENIKSCEALGVELDDEGFVIKGEEIYDAIFSNDYYYTPYDYKKCTLKINNEEDEQIYIESDNTASYNKNQKNHFKIPRFIKKNMFEEYIYPANPAYFNNIPDFNFHKQKFNKNLKYLKNYIENDFLDNISILEKKDYSKSLIFCLGNLDEVYHMSHNINPDEDADLFHEHSLRITMPEIKDALSTRFRMEQIGRLGNTHYIYPSLSKNSYEKIIEMFLNKKKIYLKNEFGLDVKFHNSINDILYKEGVYPSQGARPLLSTFNSMIDSYISNILTDIATTFINATELEWLYENDKYIIKVKDNKNKKIKFEYKVECVLENLRKTDDKELQTLVAIHESGHALINCLKMGIVPIDVLSKTANLGEGLCRCDYGDIVETKDFIYKRILVCLGGLEAEKLIFGKNFMSAGSYSDLQKVTTHAFDIVKSYGMDKDVCLISATTDNSPNSAMIKSSEYEKRVLKIIRKAQNEVQKCLKNNKKYLLLLGEYLIENSKIDSDGIKQILEPLNIQWKDKDNYYNFKDIVRKELEKII